jgi:hypothetical protein
MKFLPLVWRNLLRSKRRTFLTILSVAVSLFVFAALMSLPSVVNQLLRDRAGSLRLVCRSKGGIFYSLPEAYARRILALPHVEAVIGENLFMGTYRRPDDLLRLPPAVFVESLTIAIAIGALGSLAPAVAATRREISASLRAV